MALYFCKKNFCYVFANLQAALQGFGNHQSSTPLATSIEQVLNTKVEDQNWDHFAKDQKIVIEGFVDVKEERPFIEVDTAQVLN